MPLKFIDLFAGLGGFHLALQELGHECVFASEIDDELRALYKQNFPDVAARTYGDITKHKDKVPAHDILCAGFPCQPFSKSGFQKGILDETRGTLFHEIIDILAQHQPEYLILENVGNFERHDEGRTWKVVKKSLETLGYEVRGTEHFASGGPGLLSPHHLGYPHSRERFFIIGRLGKLPSNPFPASNRKEATSLGSLVQSVSELTETDKVETALTRSQRDCIEHWNEFLSYLPEREVSLPSFPIWGDEIDATYPFEETTPFSCDERVLRASLNGHVIDEMMSRDEMLALLPNYARTEQEEFPQWKQRFIKQNRTWFQELRTRLPQDWITKLRTFPPSLRKLEWNCKGEDRDLWKHVLQFRPSGLRVKRYNTSPALVAMTTTQIPILGPERRFLTRIEGLRLQGLPDDHNLPVSRAEAFKALGNGVHVKVVKAIAEKLLTDEEHDVGTSNLSPASALSNTHCDQIDDTDLPLFALYVPSDEG